MSKSQSKTLLNGFTVAFLVVSLIVCGCEHSDGITVYRVPKYESIQTADYLASRLREREAVQRDRPKPVPTRMIALIIPKGTLLWFLKLEGDVDAVAAREIEVREFLKTIQFSADEKMEWTLPAGWKQLPPTEMRHATLVLGGQPSLEMSVTKFPSNPDLNLDEQLLMNFNRWRGQLSLEPIPDNEFVNNSEKLNLNGFVAYWGNFVGTSTRKVAGMLPTSPSANPSQGKVARPSSTPVFEKPSDWTDAPAAPFAIVTLQAKEGDSKILITVTPAKGSLDANVNRWRGQVGLPPLEPSEVAAIARKIDVGSLAGNFYEITNGAQTILGVVVEDRDQSWFIKLNGDSVLAARERPQFEKFLKSLQFH